MSASSVVVEANIQQPLIFHHSSVNHAQELENADEEQALDEAFVSD